MIIAFNGVSCGWANNGGTQSIFRMAGALCDLGHEVQLWGSSGPGGFSWFRPHPDIQFLGKVDPKHQRGPAVDVLVDTSCKTTKRTHEYKAKKVGIQWLRAHENWTYSDNALYNLYKLPMPLWVNSEGQKELVKKHTGRKNVKVQYCGIPVDDFYPVDRDEHPFTIGGLYSPKGRKKWKTVATMAEVYDARFLAFGTEKDKEGKLAKYGYLCKPSMEDKRKLYSQCDIWFGPSKSEGLHIPPMEASLCGAVSVCNKAMLGGTSDWCKNGAGFQVDPDDTQAMIKLFDSLRDPAVRAPIVEKAQHKIRTKIGTVEQNAKKFAQRAQELLENGYR